MGLSLTADDFGLTESVNEAVERAHRDGVLSAASLMVAGPAAADAIRRAKQLPGLRVGLHLVVIEGPAILPPAMIPLLVDRSGLFPSDQLALGLRYFFHPPTGRQLAREIDAQFAAFAATGLRLAHADAHKHMHLHPTVAAIMLRAGKRHGLDRVRVPSDPFGGAVLRLWTRLLRRQVARAGMSAPDHVLGLAYTGHMTEACVLRLLAERPDGDCELYFHPATRRDAVLAELMPTYEHEAELEALLSDKVRAAVSA